MHEIGDSISRVKRSKEEAKVNYDRLSRWYDLLSGSREKKFKKAGLQKLSIREGEVVLEIGFGTGHCLLSLAQSVGSSGRVYGLDISEGLRNITYSRVEEAGLKQRVELKLGDAAKLPFEDNSINAIFCSFTLELFDTFEIPIVLQQCKRVLKSRGRICIVAMSRKGEDSFAVKLYEWFHTRLPNYIDCRPIYVQKTLEDARFKILDATATSLWGIPVEIVLAQR